MTDFGTARGDIAGESIANADKSRGGGFGASWVESGDLFDAASGDFGAAMSGDFDIASLGLKILLSQFGKYIVCIIYES